jgi:hypothetical protein
VVRGGVEPPTFRFSVNGLRRRLPRADAPARLPAARSAPPDQARTGHPPQRTPRAGQGANGQRARAPGRRAQADPTAGRTVAAGCGDGAWPPPSPAVGLWGRAGTRQERSFVASSGSSTLDGTTSRPWFSRLSGEGEGVVSRGRGGRGRMPPTGHVAVKVTVTSAQLRLGVQRATGHGRTACDARRLRPSLENWHEPS